MAGALYRLFILVAFSCICRSQYFENDISRDNIDIHSNGTLTRVIDLDKEPSIKRIKCKREVIQVAFYDDIRNNKWQADDIVIGGAKWGCKLNSIDHAITSIFSKLLSKKIVGKRRINLVTTSASPSDIIEEASIVIHYDGQMTQRRKMESRHKRDTYSNVLSSITDVINWDKTVDVRVPFNEDNKYIYLQKLQGTPDPILTLDNNGNNLHDNAEFRFLCHNCEGNTSISYRLEIRIERKDRKPVIQTFLSQVEGVSAVKYNMSLTAIQEISLNYSSRLWQTLPESISVPLSQIKGLPEFELILSIHEDVNMGIEVITSGEFNSNIGFETTGKYVISQHQSVSYPPTNQATPLEWKIENKNVKIKSISRLSALVSIKQEISIKPYIKWTMKDIHVDFGSPIHICLRQEVQLSTEMDKYSFITRSNASTYIESYSPKRRYYLEAFKLSIWNSLLADDYLASMQVLNVDLYKVQQANCFLTAIDIEDTMENVCGQPESRITRDSPDFEKLTEIWGNKILVLSEETTESTWCGTTNRSCIHCDMIGNEVCADRLMLPSMAEAISRLSKFVSAEWPHLSLVILESWDEPTSSYPNGKHGETSLFYEGRAAIVKLGQKDTSGSINVIGDEMSVKRLQELALCAEFDFVVSSNVSSLKLCIADMEHSSNRKKRGVFDKETEPKYNIEQFLEDLMGLDAKIKKSSSIHPVSTHYPAGKTTEQVCGKMDDRISLDDSIKRVLQYPFDDVEFSPEGPSGSTCSDNRRCNKCASYVGSERPWKWCITRIMTPRCMVRLRRLSILINREIGVGKREKEEATQTTQRLTACKSSLAISDCEKKLGKEESKYCKQCLRERRCCKKRCPDSKCTITDTDTIRNMRASCKDIFGLHACPTNIGIESKECRLFKDECVQDWCHTFSGPELRLLMKVIMIWEACAAIWKEHEQDITTEMADVSSDDYSLFDFFEKKCEPHFRKKYTCRYNHEEKINDPTIGIGWSLNQNDAEAFNRILPKIDYTKVKDGSKCITKREVFLLFLGSVFEKILIVTIHEIPISISEFIDLPLNVKVALINANFRGDFKDVLGRFKRGVNANDWERAIKAYTDGPQYKRCGCGEYIHKCEITGICPRLNWNIEQFSSVDGGNNCKRCEKSYKCTVKGKAFTCHCIPGYTGTYCDTAREKMLKIEAPAVLLEGRILKISSKSPDILSNKKLAELAIEAGFDSVAVDQNHIEVCVKRQAGYKTAIIQYPLINMIAAEPETDNIDHKSEYALPEAKSKCPPLIDGFDSTVHLSEHYTIADVKLTNKQYRYFRLEPIVLECLEYLNFVTNSIVPIVKDSAYQTKSINKMNYDSKNFNEKYNHQCGKAVEIQCPKSDTKCNIKSLGITLIRSCTPIIRQKGIGMGIGTHADRIYFDIRDALNENVLVEIWNVNNKDVFDALSEIKEGTYFIDPMNTEEACKTPTLGENMFYIKESGPGECTVTVNNDKAEFCKSTQKKRKDVAENFLKDLLSTEPKKSQVSDPDLKDAIDQCLVKLCGGCIGKGEIWQKKMKACLHFVSLYQKSLPEMANKMAFFNTDNHKSEVQSLACHGDDICLEKTPMYSLLVKYLTSKFPVQKSKSVQELLFAPNDNPSPLLDILEQTMAMQAKKTVKVYLESVNDVSALEQVIKILLIYNTEVTYVTFLLPPTAKIANIKVAIKLKITWWALTVCPRRSQSMVCCPRRTRSMVTDYSVDTLSKERHKRSIERSKTRNDAKTELKNWELDWLSTV